MTAPLEHVELLEIEPTTRCNFTCGFCCGRHMPQADLRWETFLAALDAFPRLRHVDLHGEGEPTLHPRFFDMLEVVRARGLGASFFTNGSLLTERSAARLVALGVDKIMVSLESPEAAAFRTIRGGDLDKVVEGIARVQRARRAAGADRPALGLAVTVLRSTTGAFGDIAALYRRLDLDGGIALQALNAMECYRRHYDAGMRAEMLDDAEYAALLARLTADPTTAALLGPGARRGFFDEMLVGFDPASRRCPWLERGAFVTYEGAVRACCLMKDERAVFGHLGATSPAQIAAGRDRMRDMLDAGEIPRECAGCEVAGEIVKANPDRRWLVEPTVPPAVSVIIPCYNLGAYVEEAVDSVLAQTRQDFEIVVVNDGSTDPHTNAVLAALRRPRTTVLTTENRGLAAARNFAVEHARGRYVCALDADDRLHPQFLEKTLAMLDADPSIAFVSTWVECFGTESWTWRRDRCDFPALLAECVVLTASPVRREALAAVGGYDAGRYLYGDEDWDLWISLVERGYRGTVLPEVLFYYRQREGSMRRVAMRPEVRMRVWRTLLDKHRASYERHLPDVLLLMEDDCARLLRENWQLEYELETRLEPALAAQRAAREPRVEPPAPAAPSPAPAPASERDTQLARELTWARAEVAALRASWSWAVTAPLRWGWEVWLAIRRLLGGRA